MKLMIERLQLGFRRYNGFRQEEIIQIADASLCLSAGQVLAVIGASGAGKSLLAQAILGLLPPAAVMRGRISLDGGALDKPRIAALRGRGIGYLPQQVSALDPLARVGRQLNWAAGRAGCARAEQDMLATVGLAPEVGLLRAAELSGGMARRVMLAMAMAGRPGLLIADEPTAGLDPANRALVLALLRKLADEGSAVLIITHDLVGVLPQVDQVAVLDRGRLQPVECAGNFRAGGEALASSPARAFWNALPQNGFHANA